MFFVSTGLALKDPGDDLRLEGPFLVTSGGQSPGALQFTVIAKMVNIDYTFERLVKVGEVDISKFKTFVVVVGASGKGLGAAGIDIDVEINRVVELAKLAKANDLKIVICNLEGVSRRGVSSDRIVTALAPFASVYFIKTDANEDGFFTELSKEAGVPLATFDVTVGLKDVLAEFVEKPN
jgi:hypothetical protein